MSKITIDSETIAEARNALQTILNNSELDPNRHFPRYRIRLNISEAVKRIDKLLPDVKFEGSKPSKPKVICICGSTKFADAHAIAKWEFEKAGKTLCLMINYLPIWYAEEQGWKGFHHFGEQSGLKEMLDELHLRKIDLADEIFVINKNGYIGESTKAEIDYANSQGKPVLYLEPQGQHYEVTKHKLRSQDD